ncbi:MAG: SUMF1/EgtB/PvdO family nonheme iron enzyme [Bacteroidales bacterium]|nr:SUMF1/EgtB/PvdO family nonheme iron enzyme [Bacteroidales bacterium]
MSVKQDTDGKWYWTVDGEWLLADGHKVSAEAVTPKLKIEDNNWYVSYDGGASWTLLGKAVEETTLLFKDVNNDDPNYLVITLADGTVISIPKKIAFGIKFDADPMSTFTMPSVNGSSNAVIELKYEVLGAAEDEYTMSVWMEGDESDGWRAKKAERRKWISGQDEPEVTKYIALIPPVMDKVDATTYQGYYKSYNSAEVNVLLVHNNGTSVLKKIHLSGVYLDISTDLTAIPAEGGDVEVYFETSLDFPKEIEIDDFETDFHKNLVFKSDKTWLNEVPDTKEMADYYYEDSYKYFRAPANPFENERHATITVYYNNGKGQYPVASFSLTQEASKPEDAGFVVNGVKFKMKEIHGRVYYSKNSYSLYPQNACAMGETVVTNALYKAVMGVEAPSSMKGDNYPLTNITVNNFNKFLTKLNELTGMNFELPSIVPWLLASNGGSFMYNQTTKKVDDYGCDDAKPHFKYSGSDVASEVAWLGYANAHEVALKKPNEFGLYDMNGNVAELVKESSSVYWPMGGVSTLSASAISWDYRSASSVNATTSSSGFGFRLYLRY